MTPQPRALPIGLHLARTARTVSQAFDRALAEAGGSSSTWQVLVLVQSEQWDTQADLAEAIGVTGATLTHHLNAMERQGLVRRWRDEGNRRVQRVELTDAGRELFQRLRKVVMRHDRRLRSNLTDDELTSLRTLLDRLASGLDG